MHTTPAQRSTVSMLSATRSPPARRVLDAIGVGLFVLGLWSLVVALKGEKLINYDEGILLTNPMLLLAGKVPYRDFYSNYPPGLFWLIAGMWKLFGVHALAVRYIGLAVHIAIAMLSGRIAGRAAARIFSPFAAGLSMAWLSFLGDPPFAWLTGLCFTLAFIALLCRAAGSARRGTWIAAGAALGAVGCFRHDLFVYFSLSLFALGACWMVRRRRIRPAPDILRGGAWAAIAATIVLGALWIPTLAGAGFVRVAADLYFDQVRYVLPARVLPFPALGAFLPTPIGPNLPAFIGQPFEGAVVLAFVGPILALFALLIAWRAKRELLLSLLLAGALAAAVIPEMIGRTDLAHALFAVTPALLLGAAIAEALVSLSVVAAISVSVLLVLPVAFHFTLSPDVRPPPDLPPRYDGLLDLRKPTLHAARQEVFAFIDENSRPGDPLYVGLWDHRWSSDSEMDLYFLADRVGATRYMQFDPNLVNRAEVQEQMIRELEISRPKVAVLSVPDSGREPNDSTRAGATLLDAYLHQNYAPVKQVERYILLLRR